MLILKILLGIAIWFIIVIMILRLMRANKDKLTPYLPDYLVYPADIIYDMMEYTDLPEVPEELKLPLLEVLNKTGAINEDLAVFLGNAFKTSKHFWLNLQANFESDKERLRGLRK